MTFLLAGFLRQGFAQTRAINRVDGIEQADSFPCLVRLQRPDQVQFKAAVFFQQSRPFRFSFLHTVFSENTLAFRNRRLDSVRSERFGNRNQRYFRRITVGVATGARNFRFDVRQASQGDSGHALPISHQDANRHLK